MSDKDLFPSYFFSKVPLRESVDFIDIGGNCYWELTVEGEEKVKDTNSSSTLRLAPYEDNDTELVDCCDLEDNYEINPTKSGKYITSFYVPVSLQTVIVGPKGTKLKDLQESTNTLIKVPKHDEPPIVKITGPSERCVASARTQISLLLLSKREKLAVTHFVSIPIYSDEIKHNFLKFKRSILETSHRGVDASIFQRIEKFHLTIVTLVILDEKELDDAKKLLQQCNDSFKKLFSGKKSKITLKGIEIMNDDPSNVDVLYGKVALENAEETENFQILADEIQDVFYKNGFVRRSYEKVKLHVTFMNSSFRKGNESKRDSFDATHILQKYRDFHFGTCIFNQIQLSIRFSNDQNGYYKAAIVVSL